MGFQCSKMKLLPQFLAKPIYLLEKALPSNLKFRPFGSLERNWQFFFWAEQETKSHFSFKLGMALQCHKMKLMSQFLADLMYLLEKPIPSNLKFQLSGWLERNWQIFFWAEQETKSQFSPKLALTLQMQLDKNFSIIR